MLQVAVVPLGQAVVPPGLATLLDISSSSTTSGRTATSTANIPLCEVVAVLAVVVPAVVPLLGMPNKDASPGGGSTVVSTAKLPLCWVLAVLAAALLPIVLRLRKLLHGVSQRLARKVPAVVPLVLAVVPLLYTKLYYIPSGKLSI